MLLKKCVNDNKSKLLFCFGLGKWIGEGAYCAKKIQMLQMLLYKYNLWICQSQKQH